VKAGIQELEQNKPRQDYSQDSEDDGGARRANPSCGDGANFTGVLLGYGRHHY
jgi:hypothetical protein